MSLLSAADQEKLRDQFSALTRSVRLVFFTQTIGCETCAETRQILDELPLLSDRIVVDELNLVLDREKAAAYGIDRAPSIALLYQDASDAEPKDSGIRFVGAPSGYEFVSLVEAVLLVGGRAPRLSDASRAQVAAVDRPMTVRVFTTPTCSYCPRAVSLAHEMAFANPHIRAYAIEATEFPDLAREYEVTGVPKTVVDDDVEILGAVPEAEFVEQALAVFAKGVHE